MFQYFILFHISMENDFKKDQSGNEGAKSGYSKIGLNIKNIINPTGLMLMINIVSMILDFTSFLEIYLLNDSPRDKNGFSLTAQNMKFSIKDSFISK